MVANLTSLTKTNVVAPLQFAQVEEPSEHEVRLQWRHLVGERLPRAALERNWVITDDHCFARVLLDVTLSRPWREIVKPPAWRHTPISQLGQAISLGEALLDGSQDIDDLNAISLRLRRSPRLGNRKQIELPI